MEPGDIAENLARVRARIDAACTDAGRDPATVRLLPVSKTRPVAMIRAAAAAGCTRFGENRVQEAAGKAEELGAGVEFSIIGHLQTNKAREVARFAAELQTLDSVDLARELQRRLERESRQLDVLLQVNSSGEPQKSGVAPAELPALARDVRAFDALRVRGLMTVAVNAPDREVVAACFRRTAELAEQLRQADGRGWDELSMGMSGDLEIAIAEGATCVRVGTAIFGARDYGPA